MPKRVDHRQRQREITEALWRIAARQGLPSATLRAVAAEAGISMNLVQYYFPTKAEMLRAGWQRMVEVIAERATAGIERAAAGGDTQAVVRASLVGVMPTDDRGRMLCAVQIAYFAVDVADRDAAAERDQLPQYLARSVADLIRGAQADRLISAAVDADLEGDALVSMTAGLISGILVDVYTVDRALAIVDYRLDRLFGSNDSRELPDS